MQTIIQDLLEVGEGYLLNQVNCQGAYGSGVAGQISKKWPQTKQTYLDRCRITADKRLLLGSYLIADTNNPELSVVHLFGQYNFGKGEMHTIYNALIASISMFRLRNPNSKNRTYVPYKMSCGLAGGNWEKVKQIIELVIPDAIICIPEWHEDAHLFKEPENASNSTT